MIGTTSAAPGAMLTEGGARTPTYRAVKLLAQFAHHFGHVFADLEPDYQPVVLDPSDDPEGRSKPRRSPALQ